MVEGARLESVYTGNRIEGSNPSVSAKRNKCFRRRRRHFYLVACRACPAKRTNKYARARSASIYFVLASPGGDRRSAAEAIPGVSA